MTKKTDAELRAQHTCTKSMSSMNCRACNAGVPYPHEPVEEMLQRISRRGRTFASDEHFWRDWLQQVKRELAARLADTIGVKPSRDEETRRLVERLIDIEQELA